MEEKVKRSWWPFQAWRGGALVEATLVTMVPIEVAVQKLRGFIADQDAKIVKTNDNELQLLVTDGSAGANRRVERSADHVRDPSEAVAAACRADEHARLRRRQLRRNADRSRNPPATRPRPPPRGDRRKSPPAAGQPEVVPDGPRRRRQSRRAAKPPSPLPSRHNSQVCATRQNHATRTRFEFGAVNCVTGQARPPRLVRQPTCNACKASRATSPTADVLDEAFADFVAIDAAIADQARLPNESRLSNWQSDDASADRRHRRPTRTLDSQRRRLARLLRISRQQTRLS